MNTRNYQMEYNTEKSPLILKEYGRNVQLLTKHIMSLTDDDQRSQYAETLVHLMKQINPAVRDSNETWQKVWDDLHIISGFKLNVESPYPIPEVSELGKKPEKVPYHKSRIMFKHYGKNIELLVDKAILLEDPEEIESAIVHLGKLMKSFHIAWNKEVIDDEVILDNIKTLSRGKLSIDLGKVKELNLFDSSRNSSYNQRKSPGAKKGSNKNNNSRKDNHARRDNNQRRNNNNQRRN